MDDFYADFGKLANENDKNLEKENSQSTKYILIKLKDVNPLLGFINGQTVSLSQSHKEKLEEVYQENQEIVALFMTKIGDRSLNERLTR